MSRNDDYTTRNLLDYLYHQNHYKLIGIDISRQTNTTIPQPINFTEKNRRRWQCDNVFCLWKVAKINSKLFFRCINCIRTI